MISFSFCNEKIFVQGVQIKGQKSLKIILVYPKSEIFLMHDHIIYFPILQEQYLSF